MRKCTTGRLDKVPPSGIRKFFDLIAGMEGVISMGVGEPDFSTPWNITEAAIRSLEQGFTMYTSNAGMPELRKELAAYLKRTYGLEYDPNTELLITTGNGVWPRSLPVSGNDFTEAIMAKFKVPFGKAGVRACKTLRGDGIPVNVTLVFSAAQALLAAKAGATFVSPFVGRLDDIGTDGMELIQEIVDIYRNYDFQTEVLVASVRHPIHVVAAARMGADIAVDGNTAVVRGVATLSDTTSGRSAARPWARSISSPIPPSNSVKPWASARTTPISGVPATPASP